MSQFDAQKDQADASSADSAALAGLDAGPEAAQGQSAELNGGTPEEKKEQERVARAQASWEGLLGEKLGGTLFDLLQKHVSYAKLNEYASGATGKIAETLKGGVVKPIKGSVVLDEAKEAEALNAFLAALAPAIQEQVQAWVGSEGAQGFLKDSAEWVQGHPGAVLGIAGAAAIGAAVAAFLSDYDPGEFAKTFNLGKGWSVGGAVDVASLQKILNKGVDSAKAFVAYEGEKLKASISATYDATKGSTVEGKVGYKDDKLTADASGSYNTKTGAQAQGNATYKNGANSASVQGSVNKDGHNVSGEVKHEGEVFQGGIKAANSSKDGTSVTANAGYKAGDHTGNASVTQNEKGLSAEANVKGSGNVGGDVNGTYAGNVSLGPDGKATIKLDGGLKGTIAGTETEASLGASHTRDPNGDASSEVVANIQLGPDGKQTTVKGVVDPSTGAFTVDLSRELGDGNSVSNSFGQDADGKATSNQTVTSKQEGFEVSASQGTQGDIRTQALNLKLNPTGPLTNFSLGLGATNGQMDKVNLATAFNLGSFSNELDLTMKEGVTTLGGSTHGKVGDFDLGASGEFNLTASRLDALGLKLGWQDPDKFRSFTAEYKLKWMEENAEYAHNFDAAFEYSVDKFAMRWQGGAQLQGGGLNKLNTDLTAGYKVNNDVAVLGQGRFSTTTQNGNRTDSYGVGAGVQYKGVPIMLNYDRRGNDNVFSIGVTIPLNFGRR